MDNRRKIFYVLSVLAIALFALGTRVHYAEVQDFLGENLSNILEYAPMVSISLATWLAIFGIIFVPKNWVVWVLIAVMLVIHIYMLLFFIAFSSKISEIGIFYLNILSFGIIGG